VQVVTTEDGVPVEFAFLPGAASDVRGLGILPLSLAEGSELFMDSGYTDYAAEDVAQDLDSVTFRVQRRRDSRRWDEPPIRYYKQLMRKRAGPGNRLHAALSFSWLSLSMLPISEESALNPSPFPYPLLIAQLFYQGNAYFGRGVLKSQNGYLEGRESNRNVLSFVDSGRIGPGCISETRLQALKKVARVWWAHMYLDGNS
jgi:hypothetical protein